MSDKITDKEMDAFIKAFGEAGEVFLNKHQDKQALNEALEKSSISTEGLIPEPLDKSIHPDPCKHKFIAIPDAYDFTKTDHWTCQKCGLDIYLDEIAYILNHYADIENWRNDDDK